MILNIRENVANLTLIIMQSNHSSLGDCIHYKFDCRLKTDPEAFSKYRSGYSRPSPISWSRFSFLRRSRSLLTTMVIKPKRKIPTRLRYSFNRSTSSSVNMPTHTDKESHVQRSLDPSDATLGDVLQPKRCVPIWRQCKILPRNRIVLHLHRASLYSYPLYYVPDGSNRTRTKPIVYLRPSLPYDSK